MSSNHIKSIFEIADWFFRRADQDDVYLDKEKLQHLMFLSQVHYALTNNFKPLFAGFFICTKLGFEDPNLSQILNFGLPLMAKPDFEKSINTFLEVIWQKYSVLSNLELSNFIKNSDSYLDNIETSSPLSLSLEELTTKFRNNLKRETTSISSSTSQTKVLISQNGPVVVSKWQPRKVNTSNSKEN